MQSPWASSAPNIALTQALRALPLLPELKARTRRGQARKVSCIECRKLRGTGITGSAAFAACVRRLIESAKDV